MRQIDDIIVAIADHIACIRLIVAKAITRLWLKRILLYRTNKTIKINRTIFIPYVMIRAIDTVSAFKGLFPLRLRVALRGERWSAIAIASTSFEAR